ncbi:MAG: hypoxanthine-guanine phosphoribosyltransferase [Proteobacteria bacterium]|jgi:hypoxanthine phosphoribosyltransferase|nr:hypoxanthine-guanine phosphoribosyltransferase [Pseudomonadota bacterium]
MQLNYQQALEILKNSEILYSKEQLVQCIGRMAKQIESEIVGEIPIFLSVMNGGMFFGSSLLQQISGAFVSDYIHASRYGDATFGSSHITWFRQPKLEDIQNKTVYILDDILDEGHTLSEIKRFLLDAGAKECKIAVLIDKDIGKVKPITADYVGLSAPNHFLFGYGMDIYGLYRQLPDIYMYNS